MFGLGCEGKFFVFEKKKETENMVVDGSGFWKFSQEYSIFKEYIFNYF